MKIKMIDLIIKMVNNEELPKKIKYNGDIYILESDNIFDFFTYKTIDYGKYDTKECECGETEEIWGFEVNGNNGKLFGISADDMKKIKGCPNKWDCEAMLLFGIGLFINKVTIDLIEKVENDE